MSFHNLTGLAQELEMVKYAVNYMGQVVYYTQANIGDYKISARREDDRFGWLICNGRLLDRKEYAALFDVIGTSFGSTTSSNFRLPDLRGRVAGGIGAGTGLTNRTLGNVVGSETHLLTIGELPAHDHGGATSSNGAHTHTTNATGSNIGLAVIDGLNTPAALDNAAMELNLTTTQALTINSDGTHAHTISSQGGGNPHNNMQPTVFTGNYFIFAGVSGPIQT